MVVTLLYVPCHLTLQLGEMRPQVSALKLNPNPFGVSRPGRHLLQSPLLGRGHLDVTRNSS